MGKFSQQSTKDTQAQFAGYDFVSLFSTDASAV